MRALLLVAMVLALAGCPSSLKYPSCDGDKDCKNGEKCVNKKCVQCAADTDCGPGMTCELGGCKKKADYCDKNEDCPDGKICQEHVCTGCTTDDQCGPGGKCQNGACKKPSACAKDEDCAEDEDCVNKLCQKGGGRTTATTAGPKCTLQAVYFAFDQYSLNDESKALLQKDQECLQKESARKVSAVGYTDPRGTAEYNVALSDDRAQAVITYLGRLGTDPARMRKVPKGASDSKGTDEAGWAQDRRVELVWE